MHVAWKGRFEPTPGHPRVTLARVRRLVTTRLHLGERFRQRLAFPPAALSEPLWIDDEAFDVAAHVVALSGDDEPLPRARFEELTDLVLSEPLDRARPLWRIHVAPRLEDGSVGIVMKAHHAMVDGLSAVSLALLLLDGRPDAPAPAHPPQAWQPERRPSRAELALGALAEYGRGPLRAAGQVARLATSPARRAHLGDTLRRAALAVGEDVLRPAPESWLNVPIGPRRTLVGHSVPLRPYLDIKRARDVSLNDVVLAVVAGALRRLALLRGVAPTPLKVMVPVSRRASDGDGALGNQIAFVFVTLPVHLHQPLGRLEAVHAETRAFKEGQRAGGGEAILRALGALPGPLQARAARLASSPRMYNLVVSNVPGPRFPVYLLGAEGREAFPVIPLSEGHALSIGVFTLRDTLCFGAYADPTALPEVVELPMALDASAEELAVQRGRRRRPAPRVAALTAGA